MESLLPLRDDAAIRCTCDVNIILHSKGEAKQKALQSTTSTHLQIYTCHCVVARSESSQRIDVP